MRYGMVRTESWLFQDPRIFSLCQEQHADMLENRSIKFILKNILKEFGILLSERTQYDCDPTCYLLENLFDQDEAVRGRLISKRVSLKSSEF